MWKYASLWIGYWVNSDGKVLCKAIDAIRVAEACWAAVISSAEHRVVKLPWWI